MALKVGELTAFINGDSTGLNRSLGFAKKDMQSAAGKLASIAFKAASAYTAAGAAIVGGSLKLFSDFESSALKVKTIMDENVVSFKNMKDGSLDLSDSIGISATEINESLYQVISATGDTENALELVGIAAKAGIGGFTDTVTAIDGLTSVMNAFGEQGPDAMLAISDQMLVAQNVGKTTFGDMATSIGKVAPVANALKITTEELFASIAILTKNGIKTSESVTALKQAYSGILKPTEQATKQAEALGLEFTAAHLANVGFAAFLDEVTDKTGGNADVMAQLFGSVEALNAMLVLTSEQGGSELNETLDKMSTSAGATEEAFKTMDQGLGDALDDLKVKFENLGIKIGEEAAPHLEDFLGKIDEAVTKFSNLSEEEQQSIIDTGLWTLKISAGVVAVGLLAGAISSIASVGGLAISAIAGIATALGSVNAGPILLAAAAVVALADLLPKIISDFGLLTEDDALENFDEYLEDPGGWKQNKREEEAKSSAWKRYTQGMQARYPEDKYEGMSSAEYPSPRYPGAPSATNAPKRDIPGAGGIVIDIHDNTISDTMDIDTIGEKIITRIRHAGFD